MTKSGLRILAAGGLVGPIIFTLTTVICASLRPGYSHITQFISELGATGTPNANLMNYAGFMAAGLMIASLGWSLVIILPKRFLVLTGSFLITLFGVGMVVVGIYSNDAPVIQGEGSLANRIHDQVSGLIFLLVIIGTLMLGFSFRRLSAWRGLWLYSLLSALISLGLFVAFINSIDSNAHTGMWQRLFLLSIFLWLGIVGQHIFKATKNESNFKS